MAEGAVVPFPLSPSTAECRLLLTALLTPLLPESAETDTEENAADDAAREFTLSTLVYCRYKRDRKTWTVVSWKKEEKKKKKATRGRNIKELIWSLLLIQ